MEGGKVDDVVVGVCFGNNYFGFVFVGEVVYFFYVDVFGFVVKLVSDYLVVYF